MPRGAQAEAPSSPPPAPGRVGWALAAVVLLAVLVRLPYLNQPLVDEQNWRQTDTAAMARNFYEEDMRILYPRVDWRGTTPGYVESEFPLYPYLVALVYRAAGGVDEAWGRAVSLLASVLTVVFLYALGARLFNPAAGLWAGLLYAILPLSVFYGRAFMVEALMILFSVAGIHLFAVWLDTRRPAAFAGAALAVALALLVKIPTLYLGLPLLYLAYRTHGRGLLRRWELYLFAALVLAPAALWYAHAHTLFQETRLTFGIWNRFGYSKFGPLAMRLDPQFYGVLAERIFGIVLTPVGGVLLLAGLLWPPVRAGGWTVHVWVLAIVIYFFVAAEGNRALEYYQLPLVPPAALLGGRVLAEIQWRRLIARTTAGRFLPAPAAMALLVLLIGFLSFTYVRPSYTGHYYYPYFRGGFEIGRRIADKTPPESLLLAVDVDENVSAPFRAQNPALLYYAHRKGWQITPDEATPETIAAYADSGAAYLVAPIGEVMRRAELRDYLQSEHRVVASNERFAAFGLR
ncbi:MAG: phospholipid carrier-dependent glycosyltransferase [Candidatus Eisenbacteria bacterium]|nr:phospholipid carrier-dependent glycosyltransferase [Candidatus Eisenbacteria bacterium]